MKRSHLTRLQDSDVFSAPQSLGLKVAQQNCITSDGLVAKGLHPLSYRYARNTIGETVAFTDWVQKVLKINGTLPRRSYWSESTRNWEKTQVENDVSEFERIKPKLVRNTFSAPSKLSVMVSPTMCLMSAHVDAFMAQDPDNG